MTTFIDTNVLIALVNPQEPHHQWSSEEFILRKLQGPVIISDMVYAEYSIAFASRIDTDAAVQAFGLTRLRNSDDVHFRAGQAYKKYKKNKGQKKNVLPDFLIGALAEQSNAPLMTANASDFAGYFPSLKLITP